MRLIQKALTFDDVLLVPAYSAVLPRDTQLGTQLTRDISINIPLVSAAMDTVTEGRLAIVMAQEGGIGIIHKNLTPAEQAREVAKVKRYESGVLRDPITISPDMTVRDVIHLSKEHGFSGFPVLQGKKVVGIITNRDLRFEEDLDAKVSEKMTPKDRLVTIKEGSPPEEAKRLMNKHRLERVLVVDDAQQQPGSNPIWQCCGVVAQRKRFTEPADAYRERGNRVGPRVFVAKCTRSRVAWSAILTEIDGVSPGPDSRACRQRPKSKDT